VVVLSGIAFAIPLGEDLAVAAVAGEALKMDAVRKCDPSDGLRTGHLASICAIRGPRSARAGANFSGQSKSTLVGVPLICLALGDVK